MSWSFYPADAYFEQVCARWDSLNQAHSDHILLDSQFVAPLIRHFGRGRVLLGVKENSDKPAMALLVQKSFGIWETFQPSQAPLGLILLGRRDHSGEGLLDLLRELPGIPMQLAVLQQDPDYSSWPPFARSDIQSLDYIQTPRLRLAASFEEFWQSRSGNLRHNLSRQLRRLEEQGHRLELCVRSRPEEMPGCIQEYARLESAGWKGEEESAIAENNVQGHFYRDALTALSARGEAVVYELLLNGRVVASDLCVARNSMLVVLKTTYDESWKGFSMGLLLRQEMIRRLYADQHVQTIEFYGRVMDWHTKFTREIRTMYHLNCFRAGWVAKLRKIVGNRSHEQ